MRAPAICVLLLATTVARAETGAVDSDAAFAAALHGQLATQKGNLFYSPASVRMALAMIAVGARGATQAELARALSLPAGPEAARSIEAQTADWERRAHASDPDRVVLRVVNHAWTQRGADFVPEYLRTLREVFRAPISALDFTQEARARAAINHWVAEATEQLIRSLVGDGVLTRDTKMVLTNAVYLKARWQTPFAAHATRPEPFFVTGRKPVKVPMMHLFDSMNVARVPGALLLELPYSDGQMVMDIVLPTAKDGIAAVEAAYVKGAFNDWLGARAQARVDISLPKLRMSSAQNLNWVLRGLGVVHATDPDSADFSGIDGNRDLYIGPIIHKAMVDIDETRTEAAAATADDDMGMAMAPPPPPIVFRADHPFLFVIRDTTQPPILFVGRVVDPTAR